MLFITSYLSGMYEDTPGIIHNDVEWCVLFNLGIGSCNPCGFGREGNISCVCTQHTTVQITLSLILICTGKGRTNIAHCSQGKSSWRYHLDERGQF